MFMCLSFIYLRVGVCVCVCACTVKQIGNGKGVLHFMCESCLPPLYLGSLDL